MENKKIYLVIAILLLFISVKTNFLKSIYEISITSYNERISKLYGYCHKEGIGYVNFIKQKFKVDKKINLINSLKENNNNSGYWAVYNTNFPKKESKSDYLIVINYNKIKDKIDFNNFEVLHNYKDCFYLKKK